MLRTILTRNSLIRVPFRTIVLRNAVRTFSVQCRRKLLQSSSFNRKSITIIQQCNALRYYSSELPPHIKVTLPALSPTMEEGTLISWDKKEGDKLNDGDLLAEIETDKATMAFETPEEGYLAKILVPAGSKGVPIGKLVCIIVENESDIAAFKDYKDDSPAAPIKPPASPSYQQTQTCPTPPAPVATPPPPPPVATPPPPPQQAMPPIDDATASSGRIYASPMARRLAEQRNVRLQGKGTGLYGSITSSDLEGMGAAVPPPAMSAPAGAPRAGSTPYTDIPVSNIRAVIAKRLVLSKQTIPHFYLTSEMKVEELLKIREKFNKKLAIDGIRLSINDFIIKATAMASKKIPEANSAWHDTYIRKYEDVDVSVAVSTERGLLTPIVFNANRKGVTDISKEMKQLAAKARDGKLQPYEFQGGTISISNMGMYETDHFSAIINPPQSCILAVGTINSKLILDEKSEKGDVKFITATLSCDHRVVDGTVGAEWLKLFRSYIEDPVTMLL